MLPPDPTAKDKFLLPGLIVGAVVLGCALYCSRADRDSAAGEFYSNVRGGWRKAKRSFRRNAEAVIPSVFGGNDPETNAYRNARNQLVDKGLSRRQATSALDRAVADDGMLLGRGPKAAAEKAFEMRTAALPGAPAPRPVFVSNPGRKKRRPSWGKSGGRCNAKPRRGPKDKRGAIIWLSEQLCISQPKAAQLVRKYGKVGVHERTVSGGTLEHIYEMYSQFGESGLKRWPMRYQPKGAALKSHRNGAASPRAGTPAEIKRVVKSRRRKPSWERRLESWRKQPVPASRRPLVGGGNVWSSAKPKAGTEAEIRKVVGKLAYTNLPRPVLERIVRESAKALAKDRRTDHSDPGSRIEQMLLWSVDSLPSIAERKRMRAKAGMRGNPENYMDPSSYEFRPGRRGSRRSRSAVTTKGGPLTQVGRGGKIYGTGHRAEPDGINQAFNTLISRGVPPHIVAAASAHLHDSLGPYQREQMSASEALRRMYASGDIPREMRANRKGGRR